MKTGQDRIYLPTRILAALIIPFLALAVIVLFFFPEQSGERFAWPVSPPLNAMLMAAAYAGGIYFFGSVLISRQWHKVKAGFLPVSVFAALLGIATILHWDRFTPGHIAFVLWSSLYFSTPFLVFAVWFYNRREDPGNIESISNILPKGWRLFFGFQALSTLTLGLGLFVFPALFIPVWPWQLTPLTARVLGALFTLPGVLGLEIALDPRWDAAKRLVEAQGVSFLFILVAVLRSRTDFITGDILYIGFALSILLVLAALLLLFMQMRARKQVHKVVVS